MACVVAIQNCLLAANEFFWTESMVVLAYTKSTSARFWVFVANGLSPDQWLHIASSEDPAKDCFLGLLS